MLSPQQRRGAAPSHPSPHPRSAWHALPTRPPSRRNKRRRPAQRSAYYRRTYQKFLGTYT
eukprot:6171864-Pleurochrysis_carterae.AAC.3